VSSLLPVGRALSDSDDGRRRDDAAFRTAVAISIVAHVLAFAFGPTVRVPALPARKVLEVQLIELERKPPPEVVPTPPIPGPPKISVPTKHSSAKGRAAAPPRLVPEVPPPRQLPPSLARDPRDLPHTDPRTAVPVASRPDTPVVPRVEVRADLVPPPPGELPTADRAAGRPRVEAPRPEPVPATRANAQADVPRLEARSEVAPRSPGAPPTAQIAEARPRVDAIRPELAPVVRADVRVAVPRMEGRAEPADLKPVLPREPPQDVRRDAAVVPPRLDAVVRPPVGVAPAITARPAPDGAPIALPGTARPTASASDRREPVADARREVPAPQRPQAATLPPASRPDLPTDRATPSIPTARRDAPQDEHRELAVAAPRLDTVVRPSIGTAPSTTARSVSVGEPAALPGPARPSASAGDRREPAADPRREVPQPQRPQAATPASTSRQDVPIDSSTPTIAATPAAARPVEVRPDFRADARPDARLPGTADPDSIARPARRDDPAAVPTLPRTQSGAVAASEPRPATVATTRPVLAETVEASRVLARSDPGAPTLSAPAVGGAPREVPPVPKPPLDRPAVVPAPPTSARAEARVAPLPALSGPSIAPTRDAGPRIGGAQASVVSGARPTLGPAPRGEGYDRAAAVKYAESVAVEIQRRIRYPRMAERAGLEGTVELLLTYDSRGTFLEAKVRKSSGHKSLDDAALEAAVSAMTRMGRAPARTPELSIPYSFRIIDR